METGIARSEPQKQENRVLDEQEAHRCLLAEWGVVTEMAPLSRAGCGGNSP